MGVAATNDEAFLTGGGEMGRRIAAFDWSATSIGPLARWPACLRNTVSLMLRSAIPMVLLWGRDGIMIYNDAYADFSGDRGTSLLGSEVRESWNDVPDFADNVMRTVLAGGTLSFTAAELVLRRHGRPERVWMDLDYSPVLGEHGEPAGVIAIVSDMTEVQQATNALEASEKRLRFLDDLSHSVASCRAAQDVLAITTRLTAEHLGTTICAYADMEEDEDRFTVRGDWHAEGAHSIQGEYHLANFGPRAVRELTAGRPYIVNDAAKEVLPQDMHAFTSLGVAATICMPLVKEGRLTALMTIIHATPRVWSEYDLGVIVEVTERSWAHVERVRIEQQLDQHDALLRRSQTAGGVGLFSIDIETNMIACTPEFCRIFGFEECETISTMAVEALIVPDDAHIVSNDERRRMASAPLDVEYRIHRADTGEERLVARKGEYECDESGKPLRLVGAVQDVTERRRIQLALEKSEAGFSALAQYMPSQVWTARSDGLLDWFNTRVYAYCGLPEGSLDGQRWTRIVHPDDMPQTARLWARALATGETYETEFRLKNAEGEYRWHVVRAVPLRDSRGIVTSWVGTNTDIHERKIQEAESVRDRNRLWSISKDLLLVCDHDGRITAINPSAERLLGWREEEMVGHALTDFVHPDDRDRTVAKVERIASGVMTSSFENRYRARGGDYRLFAWTAVPDGERIHGVGRDITDERATEEALRQSQKMEAVGQLTGGIAHDFNNLLQGITGSLDVMENRLRQGRTGDLEQWLSGAKTSANRAAALTHRLLAFSRRQPLDPRPVRANPLIASMDDMLRRTLGETVKLELVLAGGLWLTRCDPNQLESAILNLAINARDAMPDGGKLIIETGNAHLDSAWAASEQDIRPGQYVCICVTDTGAGMSKEVIARAFEPFFTTKPLGQGTGLGLSMIYGFTRQSEGHVQIDSEPGDGTSVKLFLPRFLGEEHEEEDVQNLATVSGSQEGEVVLVVEDEPLVRGLIVEVLGELGYHAIEAADGPEGLAILQSKRRIDLLVTDIGLPGLNGRQVADGGREVRPGLKVLFMTGYAENAALASGFLKPGMAMVTKPFRMEALAAKIREIIGEG